MIIKYIIALLSIILFLITGYAQEKSNIQIIPNWGKKEIHKLESQTNLIIPVNDTLKEIKIDAIVSIRIAKKKRKNYVIEWEYKSFMLTDKSDALLHNPLIRILTEFKTEKKIIYEIEKSGKFIGIINLKEIQSDMLKELRIMQKAAKKGDSGFASLTELAGLLNNTEDVRAIVNPELKEFHRIYDLDPIQYTTVEKDTMISFSEGGPQIPGKSCMKVSEENSESGKLQIEFSVSLNKEKYLKTVKDNLELLFPDPDDRPELPNVDYKEVYFYIIDTKTGWVNKLSINRDIRYKNEVNPIQSIEIKITE